MEVTTPQQRAHWNDYLDSLQGKSVDNDTLFRYKQDHPDFSITPEMVPQIKDEHADIRTGNSFGNMSGDDLVKARAGMSNSFIGENDLSKSYYPMFKRGPEDFGTDIESYAEASKIPLASTKDSPNVTAPAPGSAPNILNESDRPSNAIPLPDYNDQASRNKFIHNWENKYGDLQGRGDTVLRVNDVPRGGSDTMKNISTKLGDKYGIDPALLYSSAMEEGASGLFKNLNGTDTKGRKPGEFGYQDNYGDKAYPINGGQNFGLQTFADRFPDLVKAGYLPNEFASQFRSKNGPITQTAVLGANNFKTPEAAMQAKAAMMKQSYDNVDKEAKNKGIELSPKARDFFALAQYNGGEGGMERLMKEYSQKGLLKDDKFFKENPDKGLQPNLDIWAHVAPRMKMADNLKEQKLF